MEGRPKQRASFERSTIVVAVLALLITLLLVILAIDFNLRRTAPAGPRHVTMPDGTTLVLEKVTYGNQHQFMVPSPRRGFAPFRSVVGQTVSAYTPKESIVVWFSRRDHSGATLDFSWWSRCVAIDSHGCKVQDGDAGINHLHASGNTSSTGTRPFQLFQPLNPRRDKFVVHSAIRPFRHAGNTFKLQVMDVRDTVVAEFDIVDPSPTAGQYPTWAPDELPVTQSDGDVSVTLTDLTARNSTSGLESRSTAAVDVTPIFRVTQNGLPTTQWTRSRSTIYDALGNESQLYGCELCPEESAWKLKMRVFRNEHAAFDPSEQWTVGGVELPTTETKKLNYESRLQDVTISLLALGQSGRVSHYGLAQSSSGSWSYSGDISSGSMGKQHLAEIRTTSQGSSSTTTVQCDIPHLIARVSNQTVDHDAPLLMVIDDKGQRINVSSPINHIDNTQIWFLEIPDDAGSLQLTFNVQRARVFEFTVKPPRVEPTEPPLRSDAGNH